MESQICEIIDALLDYHHDALENEGCGPLGNNEVGRYRARDLAKKYGLSKVVEQLTWGEPNYKTAEEYSANRDQKFEILTKERIDKEATRMVKNIGEISGFNLFCIEHKVKFHTVGRIDTLESYWKNLSYNEHEDYTRRAKIYSDIN